MAAAKASLTDRVVPEEQFYDQAAEDEFSGEKTTNDATRATRKGAGASKVGSIGDLLSNLITSIGDEQTACKSQFNTDSTTCTNTQADARVCLTTSCR